MLQLESHSFDHGVGLVLHAVCARAHVLLLTACSRGRCMVLSLLLFFWAPGLVLHSALYVTKQAWSSMNQLCMDVACVIVPKLPRPCAMASLHPRMPFTHPFTHLQLNLLTSACMLQSIS